MALISRHLLVLSILFFQLFAWIPSVCAQKRDTDNLIERTISHDGLKRKYYVYAPPGYDPGRPIPLVFVFHGYKQSAKDISELTRFNTIADKYNFLVVYPQAYKGSWSDGRKVCWLHSYNDLGYVDKLISRMEQKWNADRTRVYAAGYGNGGFFSQALGLHYPDKIAAIASVAATLPQIVLTKRKPKKPVSVLFIVGDKDPVVPFSGGTVGENFYRKSRGQAVSAAQALSFWIEGNGCNSSYQEGSLPDIDPTDQTRIKWIHYRNCKKNSEVILFAVMGGGHCWPGSRKDYTAKKFGLTSMDLDASQEIWRFFAKHR